MVVLICFCLSIYRYDFWADALIRDITNKKTCFFSSVLGLAKLVAFTNDGDDWRRAEKICHPSCLRIHYSCLSASYSGLLILLLSGCPTGIGKPSQWDDQSSTQGAGLVFWHQPNWPHLKSFLQRHQEYGRFPSRTISLRSPVMSAFFQRHLSLSSNKCPLIICFVYLTKYYLKSSREIRRLEAITNSPVYSLLADTVAGLEVIRSSEMEDAFLKKFYRWVMAISISAFSPKWTMSWFASHLLVKIVLKNFNNNNDNDND